MECAFQEVFAFLAAIFAGFPMVDLVSVIPSIQSMHPSPGPSG